MPRVSSYETDRSVAVCKRHVAEDPNNAIVTSKNKPVALQATWDGSGQTSKPNETGTSNENSMLNDTSDKCTDRRTGPGRGEGLEDAPNDKEGVGDHEIDEDNDTEAD
jgi:hypothetical protein